jgi:hypothetical protein
MQTISNVIAELRSLNASPVQILMNGEYVPVQDVEVQLLKLQAIKGYAVDGGTLYECSDTSDYVEMIAKHRTAYNAWRAHVETEAARYEIQAGYDAY